MGAGGRAPSRCDARARKGLSPDVHAVNRRLPDREGLVARPPVIALREGPEVCWPGDAMRDPETLGS